MLTTVAVRTEPCFAEGWGKSSSPELGCSWVSCGFGRVRDGLECEPKLQDVVQAGGKWGDFTVVAARQN